MQCSTRGYHWCVVNKVIRKKRAYQGDLGSPSSKMTLSPIILTSTDPLALSESDLIAFERALTGLTGQIHVILVILLLVK